MIIINNSIQKKLLDLPETGNGFQIVDALYSSGEKDILIIFNAKFAFQLQLYLNLNLDIETYMEVAATSLEVACSIENEENQKSKNEVIDVFEIPVEYITKLIKKTRISGNNKLRGAKNAILKYTKENERYVRFSHYFDDVRVDKTNMCLRPGSYATTYEDAQNCIVKKLNINDRYALPNNLVISYAFYIKPNKGITIKKGIAQPLFEYQGGGIEVLFPNGTNSNSIERIDEL